MANTNVTLANDGGIYIPTVSSVAVNAGDTVTFTTSDGSAVDLFFSPAAAAILAPAPGAVYSLPTQGSAQFTFTSSSAGAYSVFFATDPSQAPSQFPAQVSQQLLLEIGSGNPVFNGPGGGMRRGS
jgi:plastocyanin